MLDKMKINQNSTYQRPAGWGNDSFSEFMIMAEENGYATFQNGKPHYKKLSEIHDIFRKAIDAMHNSANWFELLFFIKAHSVFLAASRLGLATQVAETSPLIRSIIENTLYGFYLHKHPEHAETWLKRNRSDEAKKEVKKIFVIGTIFDTLRDSSPSLETIARKLYEQSVDYGAHPNEKGLTMALKYTKGENSIRYDVTHLTDNPIPIIFCLKFIARAAVLCLKILQLVLTERFKITGLDIDIENVSKNL